MRAPKILRRARLVPVKTLWRLHRAIEKVLQDKQRRDFQNALEAERLELEAERLDRLRNPSKYLGK
jgi:hypothetical protein